MPESYQNASLHDPDPALISVVHDQVRPPAALVVVHEASQLGHLRTLLSRRPTDRRSAAAARVGYHAAVWPRQTKRLKPAAESCNGLLAGAFFGG
jgi:hypothetical protein